MEKEKKKRRQNYEEKKTKWNACVGFQRAYEVIYRWKKGSDDIKQIISLKDHCELSIDWSWIAHQWSASLHVLCYNKIWPNKGRRLRKSGFIHRKYWDSCWFYLSVVRGLTLFASPCMSYVWIRVDLSLNFGQFPVATKTVTSTYSHNSDMGWFGAWVNPHIPHWFRPKSYAFLAQRARLSSGRTPVGDVGKLQKRL